MNRVILLGRLVRDPECRTTQSGKITTEFTLAVDKYPGSKEADFIKIVTWEKIATACADSLNKGQRALVEGRLQIRSYDGKDGQKRWVTEIIAHSVEYLERKTQQAASAETTPSTDSTSQFGGHDVAPDEEIPF